MKSALIEYGRSPDGSRIISHALETDQTVTFVDSGRDGYFLTEGHEIVYTSGSGGLFKSGIPVGKVMTDKETNENIVNFFSDFGQLDYVKIVSFEKLTAE